MTVDRYEKWLDSTKEKFIDAVFMPAMTLSTELLLFFFMLEIGEEITYLE